MKFRKGFAYTIETRPQHGNQLMLARVSLYGGADYASGDVVIDTIDCDDDHTILHLTHEQAEELAVALTYALTSEDDTPTEKQ